jgi:hypothetical protein
MSTLLAIIAGWFFLGSIAIGIDAFKLEGRISEAWIVCMCWSLLLCGFAIFMAVLMA